MGRFAGGLVAFALVAGVFGACGGAEDPVETVGLEAAAEDQVESPATEVAEADVSTESEATEGDDGLPAEEGENLCPLLDPTDVKAMAGVAVYEEPRGSVGCTWVEEGHTPGDGSGFQLNLDVQIGGAGSYDTNFELMGGHEVSGIGDRAFISNGVANVVVGEDLYTTLAIWRADAFTDADYAELLKKMVGRL